MTEKSLWRIRLQSSGSLETTELSWAFRLIWAAGIFYMDPLYFGKVCSLLILQLLQKKLRLKCIKIKVSMPLSNLIPVRFGRLPILRMFLLSLTEKFLLSSLPLNARLKTIPYRNFRNRGQGRLRAIIPVGFTIKTIIWTADVSIIIIKHMKYFYLHIITTHLISYLKM